MSDDKIIDNVLYVHKENEKVYFEEDFLIEALDFIKYSINNFNSYHVCTCHEHEDDKIIYLSDLESLGAEIFNDAEEFKLDNIQIFEAPSITHNVNGDGSLNMNIFCNICGSNIFVNLDIFVEALDRYKKLVEDFLVEDVYNENDNIVPIPYNKNPRVTQDKEAQIINFKSKGE